MSVCLLSNQCHPESSLATYRIFEGAGQKKPGETERGDEKDWESYELIASSARLITVNQS